MSNQRITLVRFKDSVRIGNDDVPSVNCDRHDITIDYEKRVMFVNVITPKTKAQCATAEIPFENIRQIIRYDEPRTDQSRDSSTTGAKTKGRHGSDSSQVGI